MGDGGFGPLPMMLITGVGYWRITMKLLIIEIETVIEMWKQGRVLDGAGMALIEKLINNYNAMKTEFESPERCIFNLLNERGQWEDLKGITCGNCIFIDNCKTLNKLKGGV
jgi:hypothetical protein